MTIKNGIMEISDLIGIGKLRIRRNEEDIRFYVELTDEYQNLLPKLNKIFLIYKDHRVRYGKIHILQMLSEQKAEVDIVDDVDLRYELLKEKYVNLYLDEAEINELDDQNIYFDPLGMKVIWQEREVATIKDFFYNGAHDVYEIEMSDHRLVLIPDVESFVIETNIEERFIRVVNLDQFLDIL